MILESMLVSFLWGSIPVILKRLLVLKFDYKFIYIIKIMLTTVLIFPLFVYYYKDMDKGIRMLDAPTAGVIVFAGVISIAAGWFYFGLLNKYDSNLVCALTYTAPLFTLLLAYIFLNEKVSFMSALGIVLIVSGVGIISLVKN